LLVEKDEEPPHDLDHDAKKISLLISSMLESKIFSEIHVMRKTVIDGSNTTGFQRTMLVSQGGNLKVNGKNIGVQAVCLEEDAAKLLKDEQNERNYSLDRLGVPLVEIALEPVSAKPFEVKEIALTLGRLLRATRMVKRGIGSIRQDVNISVMNSGVVEVKGVQQLDQLEKIIGYEAKRQQRLILIAEKLKKLSITISNEDVFVITEVFKDCESKIIQKALKSNAKINAIRVKKISGVFGFEPYSGIRLGKEIGQLVRFFGIGGVFHSDELPNYGINDFYVDKVRKHLELADQDGFLIIAGEDSKLDYAVNSIVKDLKFKITDLWKEENLINLLMPLSIRLQYQHSNLEDLDKLRNIFYKIGIIDSYTLEEFNINNSFFKIYYYGNPKKLRSELFKFGYQLKNDQGYWRLYLNE